MKKKKNKNCVFFFFYFESDSKLRKIVAAFNVNEFLLYYFKIRKCKVLEVDCGMCCIFNTITIKCMFGSAIVPYLRCIYVRQKRTIWAHWYYIPYTYIEIDHIFQLLSASFHLPINLILFYIALHVVIVKQPNQFVFFPQKNESNNFYHFYA